jgi:hypothetical protein
MYLENITSEKFYLGHCVRVHLELRANTDILGRKKLKN